MAYDNDIPPPPDDGPRRLRAADRPARVPPHNLEAEAGLLASALLRPDLALTPLLEVPEADFYSPHHQRYAAAIRRLHTHGQPADMVTLIAELQRAGDWDDTDKARILALDAPSYAHADAYATIVRHTAHARQAIAAAAALADAGYAADTTGLEQARRHIAELDHQAPRGRIHHAPAGVFVNSDEPDHDWAIPGLLERTDRVLLTGPEGGGKSTLIRQIAVQAAAGIHPFTGDPIDPLVVVLLDLENSRRHVRRQLRPLTISAKREADERLHVACHPEGLDLLDADDAADLEHLIATVQPDLICGGPVYKLVGGDPTEEQPAKAAAALLDRLRARHSFALILEAHQPHDSGGRRPERPYGASLWKRWPEFGLHLTEAGQIRHWRGARDERDWPAALRRGGEWPWTPETDRRAVTFARILEETRNAGRRLSIRELAGVVGSDRNQIQRSIDANRPQYDRLLTDLGEDVE